jgi:hypothetical protein
MNISNHTSHSRGTRRGAFGLLVLAALILAIFAAGAQNAQAATTNLVKNGSFEKDANGDGVPNNWSNVGLSPADKRVCNKSYAGACSFKMIGEGDTFDKFIWQLPVVSGGSGDVYTLTLWVKAKELDWLPVGNATVYLEINQTDGGLDYVGFDLPEGTYDWTLVTLEVTSTDTYNGARVLIDFEPASGKAWFDKVKLVGP